MGELLLSSDECGLRSLEFVAGRRVAVPRPDWIRDDGAFETARTELEEYFSGKRESFRLPLAPRGSPFQLRVWEELQRIPYGQTISYGELARRTGNPRASRAAGAANGQNPIAIIIPCHRVIGASGKLVGFGGGLDIKRRLLELEKRLIPLL